MKHFLTALLSAASALLLLSGCASRTVIPEEVLQLPAHANVYTAYNLWYENPMEMNADNMQRGKIIPFGTEVKLISATDSQVVFQIKDTTFTIHYNEKRMMMPIEEYIKQLFGTSVAVETASGVTPSTFEKMRRGIIEPGISRKQVIAAYGPPSKLRTPNILSDSWIYWLDKAKSKRVIFKNDKVAAEIVLD